MTPAGQKMMDQDVKAHGHQLFSWHQMIVSVTRDTYMYMYNMKCTWIHAYMNVIRRDHNKRSNRLDYFTIYTHVHVYGTAIRPPISLLPLHLLPD